jgi:hypothetical protein
MSSLLRPVGHLPPGVYWFRRALVLGVLVVVVVLLARVFGGGGGGDQQNSAATGPEQNPSSGPPPTPAGTPSGDRTTGDPTPRPGRTPQSAAPSTPTTPEDLKCAGTDVRIAVLPAARSIKSGGSLNFAVQLSAAGDECKATVDPTLLSLTISSGNDQIWTSTQCEQAIPRAVLVVAKGKDSTSTVVWNGRRSAPGCLPGQPVAKPGTYVAKAAYDGRASTPQAFSIT